MKPKRIAIEISAGDLDFTKSITYYANLYHVARPTIIDRFIELGVYHMFPGAERLCKKLNDVDWSAVAKSCQMDGVRLAMKEFKLSWNTVSAARKAGLLPAKSNKIRRGVPHTEETKARMSKIARQRCILHPEQVPYKLYSHNKGPSYPEQYFTDVLTGSRYKPNVPILAYTLDFADVERRIDLEIDGSQHHCDPSHVEHDVKRNATLSALGWTIIRVNWASFKRVSIEVRESIVTSLWENSVRTSDVVQVLDPNSAPDVLEKLWVNYIGSVLEIIEQRKLTGKERAANRYLMMKVKERLAKEKRDFNTVSLPEVQEMLRKAAADVAYTKLHRPTKITWPNNDELRRLVWEIPCCLLSKQLGVSDRAISKRCKKHGIETPGNKYWGERGHLGPPESVKVKLPDIDKLKDRVMTESIAAIAKDMNCSPATLVKRLRERYGYSTLAEFRLRLSGTRGRA